MCKQRGIGWRIGQGPLVVFAVATSLLLVAVALADVLVLTDGTRLEGTVRKTDSGYSVTAADGTVTNVKAEEVAAFHLRGEGAGGAASDVRLQSLRRSVAHLADLRLIISKYEGFIAQNPDGPAAEQAREELEQWRDFLARGLVKHGGEWVTPAERDRRLRDAFLEVSDARLQIKGGELEKAQRTLQRLLDLDAEDISAQYLLGVLAMRQGEIARARASFDKVRDQEQDHAPTLVNLAVISIMQDRHARALTFLADAMEAAPGNREILDNVAEALNLLPQKESEGRQAEQVRQLFLSQDAALRQQMAERGLYRWGSTWVDRTQLEELQALERQIDEVVDRLRTEYTQLERDVANIDQKVEENKIFMQRLEANRTVIGEDGKMYVLPLPPTYYEAERDNRLLLAEREQKLAEMQVLEQRAAQERARYPTPPYRGKLTLIGEDGVPVRLPAGMAAPADPQVGASTRPATQPTD